MEEERRILITIVYPLPSLPPSMPNRPNRVTSLPPTLRFRDVHSPARSIAGQEPLIDDDTDTHRRRWKNGATVVVVVVVVGKIALAFPPSLSFLLFFFLPTRTEGRKRFVPCFSKGRKAGRIAGANCSQERAGGETSASLFARIRRRVVDDNNGVRIRAYVPR